MSSFLTFTFGFLLIVIWIITGGLTAQASIFLHSSRDKDSRLNRAYWLTFWSAFITWFLVALFLILVILSVVGIVGLFGSGVGEAGVAAEGSELAVTEEEGSLLKTSKEAQEVKEGVNTTTVLFLLTAIILVSISGILSAIAADDITKSDTFQRDRTSRLSRAYRDTVISAVLCLGAVGVLIIGGITYIIVKENKKKKAIEQEQEQEQKQKRKRKERRVKEDENPQTVERLRRSLARQTLISQDEQQELLQTALQFAKKKN